MLIPFAIMKRFNQIIVIISCTFLVPGCKQKKEEESGQHKGGGRQNMLSAEAYVVRAQRFQNNYTTSGTLVPNEEIQILPEVAGRVTAITFQEGTKVKKGQVLLQLYNADIKAQIQKSLAQRKLQEKISARQGELLRIGGISQQDYETTIALIQSIDADIAFNQAQLRKTSVVAPFDGRIGIRNVSLGAVITPATVIATLQQTRILKMDFAVPDQYKNEVPNGKRVYFTVTGTLDTFSGVIGAIEPKSDPVTRTIKARALVQNEDHKLVAGSFTHVWIPFDDKKYALLIPSQSVIPTDRDKQVAVVRSGKAKMVTVKTGARTNDNVEIIQGLNEGDTVLTTGIMQVKTNMKVRVTKVNS